MMFELWKTDIRKAVAVYTPCLTLIAAYVLLRTKPLSPADPILYLLAAIQGMALVYVIFRDSGSAGVFTFSRPVSRERLFWSRWLLGMMLQGVTLLAATLILVLGLRSGVQDHLLHSFYYPHVKWHDLPALLPLCFASLFFFVIQMFLQIRGYVLKEASTMYFTAALFLVALCYGGFLSHYRTSDIRPWIQTGFGVYLLLCTAGLTYASLYGYRRMEVDFR